MTAAPPDGTGAPLSPDGPAEAAVGVRVPASSANLGPGFDAFAVALDAHLRVWTTPRGEQRVVADGEGAGELPSDDRNLVWRALVAYCDRVGSDVPDVSLRTASAIPLERGMGSSAAAAVAGAALGRALAVRAGAPHAGSDQLLVDVASELEGHPDNAAAAALGGLVVCHDGRARRLEPSEALRPLLCVPDARLATETARALLPATVPLADAAANGARAAVVLAGLAGAMAWDPHAMHDVLHEPARLGAMATSGALVTALRERGIGACLSGAGPSVLAVVPRHDRAATAVVDELLDDGWHLRQVDWDRAGATVVGAAVTAGGAP